MKKIIYFCLLMLAPAFASPLHAIIIRVNNQVTVNDATRKIFKSFEEAYNNAAGGDTLMVEGSPDAYTYSTPFLIKKRLVIIGPGYWLDKNPQTQANQQRTVINFTVEMAAGSAGSVLTGLSFEKMGKYSLTLAKNNILVSRCYIHWLYINTIDDGTNEIAPSGLRISQNFIDTFRFDTSNGFSDMHFNNNIVLDWLGAASLGSVQRIFSSIDNNTFINNKADFEVSTVSFKNNILLLGANSSIAISSQNIQNNLVNSDKLGASNGNKMYSENDGALFIGNIDDDTVVDNEYKVVNTRFTTMADGKEPGAFGGANPYILSGLPPAPAIYELNTSGLGTPLNGLPVTIKVKSN